MYMLLRVKLLEKTITIDSRYLSMAAADCQDAMFADNCRVSQVVISGIDGASITTPSQYTMYSTCQCSGKCDSVPQLNQIAFDHL